MQAVKPGADAGVLIAALGLLDSRAESAHIAA